MADRKIRIGLYRDDVMVILQRAILWNTEIAKKITGKEMAAVVEDILKAKETGLGESHVRVERFGSGKVKYATMVEYDHPTEVDDYGKAIHVVDCIGEFDTEEEANKRGEEYEIEGVEDGEYHVNEFDPDEYYVVKSDKFDNILKDNVHFLSKSGAYTALLEIVNPESWQKYKRHIGKTPEQRLLKAIFGEKE